MPNHTARTPKGIRVVRIERKTHGRRYVSDTWYFLAACRGKVTYFPVGTVWSDVCRKADAIHGYLRATGNDLAGAFARFVRAPVPLAHLPTAAAPLPRPVSYSTIGDVLAILAQQSEGMDLSRATLAIYHRAIVRLIRKAFEHRSGKPPTDDSVMRQPCTILTDALVSDYKTAMVRGITDERRLLSRRRTTNSVLRCAKAVFSLEARKKYRSAQLILPDLGEFLEATGYRGKGIRNTYSLPTAELITTVLEAIETHDPGLDRNMWLGAYLAYKAGLRHKEIVHFTWDWLHCDGQPYIAVTHTAEFKPKNGERDVPIPRAVYDRIVARRIPGERYLISGSENERIEEWSRRLNVLLRKLGLTANKPTHELRKWYGSYVAITDGLTVAQARLGHSSHQVTNDYYADLQFPESVRRFWA